MNEKTKEHLDIQRLKDAVEVILAEREVHKSNLERALLENLQLKHRLACVADDIEIIDRHIQNNCNKKFKKPSLNKDGSVYAEEAWHNITNIEIACDLSDESVDEWGSDMAEEYRQQLSYNDPQEKAYKQKIEKINHV